GGRACQLPFVMQPPPDAHCRVFFVVSDALRVGQFGVEVTDVLELLVPHGAYAVEDFIHPVSSSINIFALFCPPVTEEDLPLHPSGDASPGDEEHRGGEVDESHQVVTHRAWFYLSGPAHHQRDVNAAVIYPALLAWHTAPVIAEENDNGVIRDAVLIQPREHVAYLIVGGGHQVVILCDVVADFRRVGPISWHSHPGRIVPLSALEPHRVFRVLGGVGAHLSLVHNTQVEVGEKGLLR